MQIILHYVVFNIDLLKHFDRIDYRYELASDNFDNFIQFLYC